MAIDEEKCIGCGRCVEDCIRKLFTLRDGKAVLGEGICIGCGHCVAICPADAVRLPGGDEGAIRPYDAERFSIAPDRLLNFMQFRRSVRKFTSAPVEEEKLSALLDAGRYAPTGANLQQVRYILLRNQRRQFTELALKTLHDAAQDLESIPTLRGLTRYKEKWTNLYLDWKDTGRDGLFYNADCVLLIVAQDPAGGAGQLDAGLASANVELMASALGLGACYIGFFSMAAAVNPEIFAKLGVGAREAVVATLALGYPDVRYYRTVPRKRANLTWL